MARWRLLNFRWNGINVDKDADIARSAVLKDAGNNGIHIGKGCKLEHGVHIETYGIGRAGIVTFSSTFDSA